MCNMYQKQRIAFLILDEFTEGIGSSSLVADEWNDVGKLHLMVLEERGSC